VSKGVVSFRPKQRKLWYLREGTLETLTAPRYQGSRASFNSDLNLYTRRSNTMKTVKSLRYYRIRKALGPGLEGQPGLYQPGLYGLLRSLVSTDY
jgi:hypothetical protein